MLLSRDFGLEKYKLVVIVLILTSVVTIRNES